MVTVRPPPPTARRRRGSGPYTVLGQVRESLRWRARAFLGARRLRPGLGRLNPPRSARLGADGTENNRAAATCEFIPLLLAGGTSFRQWRPRRESTLKQVPRGEQNWHAAQRCAWRRL